MVFKRYYVAIDVEAEEEDMPDMFDLATAISGALHNEPGDPFKWGNPTVYDTPSDLFLDEGVGEDGLLTLPFDLPKVDDDRETNETLPSRFVLGPYGVDLFFEGYGTMVMEDGSPVFIEHYRGGDDPAGSLMVRLWENVNKEDPTTEVSLEEARDSRKMEIGTKVVVHGDNIEDWTGTICSHGSVRDGRCDFQVVSDVEHHVPYIGAKMLSKWIDSRQLEVIVDDPATESDE